MDTVVSDAEKTVNDDPNMTLSSKADVIYDIRRWEESTKQIHDRTPYSSLEVLKRTYNTLIEEDKAEIQAEIENKAEQEAKEKIMAEISKDIESEPVITSTQKQVPPEPTQSSGGCGAGTVLVDGVCELVPTQSKTSSISIEPLYIIIGVVAIGGIIGAIAVAKRGSKTPKPAKEELEKYEEKYLAKEKPVKQKPKPAKQKPVEKKETSAFCENCGNTLNPKAKFCGKCGNQV